ncbi:TonB family protein [Poseidonocella sp. HB161398]|uniref:cell envelope integrity protein TolA n=1 Tax=Poseidonocella sp. HB161398 TaxID=2320855 RepID=UPI001108B284|nr:TonB family protein [Poseidonocella sp. HB161398]
MIRDGALFLLALGGSVALHLALAGAAPEPAPPVPQGGAVAGDVALGSSFADLAAGRMAPVAGTAARTAPVPPAAARPAETVTAAPRQAAMTAPVAPAATARPVLPTAAGPAGAVSAAAAPESPRPEARPAERPQPQHRAEPARSAPEPPSAPPRGNAPVTAAAGQAEGRAEARKAETTRAERSASEQAGGRAVKRYQAQVLRRIDRAPKRSAGARGAALIGLGIEAGGGIAVLRVVKSSGDQRIDAAALDQVRRAAPFGQTPTGRRLDLTVRVESKG